MNVREQILRQAQKMDRDGFASSLLRKISLFCWETGLGPAMNALPSVFGKQAVLYFPGRSDKFSFPCCEKDGKLLLAVPVNETAELKTLLMQNPAAEVWVNDGWYTGTARLLTSDEFSQTLEAITNEQFFGKAGSGLTRRDLKDFELLEIVRSAPCTGSGGPGSKAWIWPLVCLLLLFPKKKK